MTAKVADFGAATSTIPSSEPAGTIQWSAPEVLICIEGRPKPYDGKCDIFSFGILLWELYHCSCPYSETGLDQMSILQAVLYKNLRPRISSWVPEDIKILIGETLQTDAKKRPPFSEIVFRLSPVLPCGVNPGEGRSIPGG